MPGKRKRTIVIVLLAVLLACGVFGYLAYRSRSNAIALVDACETGNFAAAVRLLENGVPASASYRGVQIPDIGRSMVVVNRPILAAAESGRVDILELLLDHGANIDATNAYGQTPLMIASRSSRFDAARLLIERGADVNAKDDRGVAPLHWAVMSGSPKVVALLMEHGARGSVNDIGQSVFDSARYRSEPERQQILDLLSGKGKP